jgi:hypothetical protein
MLTAAAARRATTANESRGARWIRDTGRRGFTVPLTDDGRVRQSWTPQATLQIPSHGPPELRLTAYQPDAKADNADARILNALQQQGWTTLKDGPPLQLQWKGPDPNSDFATALVFAPQPSSATPAEWLAQHPAQTRFTVDHCRSSDPGGLAMRVCIAHVSNGGTLVVTNLAGRPTPGKIRSVVLICTPSHATRDRLSRDLGEFAALAKEPGDVRGALQHGTDPQRTGNDAPAADAPATAADFRYRAKPGKGLSPDRVANVLYSWRQVLQVGGLQIDEKAYLLLKDGSARNGVPPVPPEDCDFAREREERPARWGHWRKSAGKLQVNFGQGWETPPGQTIASPGQPGERFDGDYARYSSFFMIGMASSWSREGIVLRPDGRFSRSKRGGVGSTNGYGDQQVAAYGAWDDKGSASTVSGPGFGGGGSSTTGVRDGDLHGRYRVDGWALELHYDSGAIERVFFFTYGDRKNIWFEGQALWLDKDDE